MYDILLLYFLKGDMMATKLESVFQADVISKLKIMFPECKIIKNDPRYTQGFPDLLILYKNKWALLEVKRSEPRESDLQPNQRYYISWAQENSFGAFIYPETRNIVLQALLEYFD